MGANTLDPGHSVTPRNATATGGSRDAPQAPSRTACPVPGGPSYCLTPALNRSPVRNTLSQHRYLSVPLNPSVRHPRSHCWASAGIPVRLRRNTESAPSQPRNAGPDALRDVRGRDPTETAHPVTFSHEGGQDNSIGLTSARPDVRGIPYLHSPALRSLPRLDLTHHCV